MLQKEHINSLDLLASLTTLRWRIDRRHHPKVRFLHLTDGLVCLRCLTRGRSSSRKLRRTVARIDALILASSVQPFWGYVRAGQNPADNAS